MLQRRINRGNWEGKLKLFEGVNRDKLSLVRRSSYERIKWL